MAGNLSPSAAEGKNLSPVAARLSFRSGFGKPQPGDRRRWLVFYYKDMVDTARQVQQCMGPDAELAELVWDVFPDGFPNLRVKKEDCEKMEHFGGTCFIVSLHNPAVIFPQLAILYSLPRMGARNFKVILPWFSTGTMERVESLGQIATASTLARLLSSTPHGPTGPAELVIFDIHALQEQFYFSDQILVRLKTAVPVLRAKMEEELKESPHEQFALAFPDDGAHKRFHTKFDDYPQIVCSKIRVGDERVVKVKEGDAVGKHVIILDDLVQSGGTLLECAKPLKAMGATKVSCFVTHAVFPNESYKKFLETDLIHKFWVTDSIPTSKEIDGKGPFEVLSIAPLIAGYLGCVFDEAATPR